MDLKSYLEDTTQVDTMSDMPKIVSPVEAQIEKDFRLWDNQIKVAEQTESNRRWIGNSEGVEEGMQDTSLDFFVPPAVRGAAQVVGREASVVKGLATVRDNAHFADDAVRGLATADNVFVRKGLDDPAAWGTIRHEVSHKSRKGDAQPLRFESVKESGFDAYFSSPEEFRARLDGFKGDLVMRDELVERGIKNPAVDARIAEMKKLTRKALVKGDIQRMDLFYKEAQQVLSEGPSIAKPSMMNQFLLMDR